MVEQSTAASRALAEEAEELGRLVSRFEVGAGTIAAPAPHRQRAVRQSAPAMKVVGGRGVSAARKPEPEGWDEF